MAVETQDMKTAPITGEEMEIAAQTAKYLSFFLGEEEYALGILSVREIIGLIDITPLPQTPDYVKGVINLRGKIIPVIELRAKFGLDSVDYTEQTCVIVVEVGNESTDQHFEIGIIVDSVREVLDIAGNQIDPPPSFGCSVPLDYITGIGKVREKVVVLLNIDRIVTSAEAEKLFGSTKPGESPAP